MRPTAVIIAAFALSAPALVQAQVFEVGGDGVARLTRDEQMAVARPGRTSTEPRGGVTQAIGAAAARYDLAPELVDAIARQESAYNPAAVSPFVVVCRAGRGGSHRTCWSSTAPRPTAA